MIIIKVCLDVIVVVKKNKNVTVCLEKREILIIFVSWLGDVFPNRCTVSFFAYETVHQRGLNCLSAPKFGAPNKQIGARFALDEREKFNARGPEFFFQFGINLSLSSLSLDSSSSSLSRFNLAPLRVL